MKCGDCNNSIVINKSYKNINYYICCSYKKNKSCSPHKIKNIELDLIILMIINFQIDLLVSINDVVKKIEMEKSINYDEKIIKNRIDKTKEDLDKYKI